MSDVILKPFNLLQETCLYNLNWINDFHLLVDFILHVRHLLIELLNISAVLRIQIALGQVQSIIYTHSDLGIVQIESCPYHVSVWNNILQGSYCNYSCLNTACGPRCERVVIKVYVVGWWARPAHGQNFQVTNCLFLLNKLGLLCLDQFLHTLDISAGLTELLQKTLNFTLQGLSCHEHVLFYIFNSFFTGSSLMGSDLILIGFSNSVQLLGKEFPIIVNDFLRQWFFLRLLISWIFK